MVMHLNHVPVVRFHAFDRFLWAGTHDDIVVVDDDDGEDDADDMFMLIFELKQKFDNQLIGLITIT